ncbi:MAG: hypothetical protein Kow0069_24240 [Promethearchaeota archaeon]
MKIFNKKAFREIARTKGRSALIVLIVASSLGFMISMRGGHSMVLASYEENLVAQNVADGRFTFSAPVPEAVVAQVAQNGTFLAENHVDDVEGPETRGQDGLG